MFLNISCFDFFISILAQCNWPQLMRCPCQRSFCLLVCLLMFFFFLNNKKIPEISKFLIAFLKDRQLGDCLTLLFSLSSIVKVQSNEMTVGTVSYSIESSM